MSSRAIFGMFFHKMLILIQLRTLAILFIRHHMNMVLCEVFGDVSVIARCNTTHSDSNAFVKQFSAIEVFVWKFLTIDKTEYRIIQL